MEKCNLPSKLDLNDVSKDSIDKAYNVYLKEIGNNDTLTFKGLPVKVTKTLDYNLRQQTFEHIISRDMKARLYDPNRLNKIPWIKHIISYCNNENCSNYSFINDRGKEYCLWCKKENYLIINEKEQFKLMVQLDHYEIKKYKDIKKIYKNNEYKNDTELVLTYFNIIDIYE